MDQNVLTRKKCPDNKGSPSRLEPHKTGHTQTHARTLSKTVSGCQYLRWSLTSDFFHSGSCSKFFSPACHLSLFVALHLHLFHFYFKRKLHANIDLYKLFTARFSVAFFSSVYLTSCPILPCLANVRFSLLYFLWKPHPPPSFTPNRSWPQRQSRDRSSIFLDFVLSCKNAYFSVFEAVEEGTAL